MKNRFNLKVFLSITVVFTAMLIMSVCSHAATIAIEAEDMDIYQYFSVMEDETSSEGKYIKSDVNSWGNTANGLTINDFPEDDKDAEFKFNAPEDGRYTLYVRLRMNISGNSVHYIVDDSVAQIFPGGSGAQLTNWRWIKCLSFKLTKGEHTLRFQHRGRSLDIDKVIFTTDVSFAPSGIGELPEKENVLYKEKSGYLFYQLPSHVPSGERPRVMVRKDDLNKIRENLVHPANLDIYKNVQELANNNSDCKLSTPNTIASMNYNDEKLAYIEARAFMYLVTGDKDWGEKARDGLLNYLKTVSVGVTPSTDGQRYGGHILFVTACVYDWCYDIFTPEERREIITLCDDKIFTIIENGWPPNFTTGGMQLSSHSTENSYLKDILAFSIAVYDEEPYFYNTNVGLLIEQYFPVRNYRSNGGYNFDGSNYSVYRGLCDAYSNYLLSKIGYDALDIENAKMPYQFIYTLRPDGVRLADGDVAGSNFAPQRAISYSAFYLLNSTLIKDQYIKGYYYTKDNSTGSSHQDAISGPIYLITNDTSVEGRSFKDLPLTKYFGSPAGVMVARTGWNMGLDTNDVVAMMKLPEHFWGSHEHYDAGSFQIFYKGMLALDSGLYASDPYTDENGVFWPATGWGTTPHDFSYHKATIGHNCMLVVDPSEDMSGMTSYGGQKKVRTGANTASSIEELKGNDYRRSEILGYDYGPDMHTPEYTYFEGDLTNAYTDKVSDYSRSFMFLNLFDEKIPAAMIVFDRMETRSSDLEKIWLLHSQEEPEVSGNRTIIRRTEGHNNGRLINDTLLPEKAKIEKVGGKGKEFWVDGENLYVHDKEEFGEGGKWRVEISPKNPNKKDYFLNVMQLSDNDDTVTPLEVTYKDLDKYIGIYIKDRAVFLRKDKGVESRELTIEAEADGELSYIVTNLKEGSWRVYNETGKEVISETVNGENGVLYFKEKAGKYTLKWEYSFNIPKKDFDVLNSVKEIDEQPVYVLHNGYLDDSAYESEYGNAMIDIERYIKRTDSGSVTVNDDIITISNDDLSLSYKNGSDTVVVNGIEEVKMSEPVVIKDGKFFVPADSMSSYTGLAINYSSYKKLLSFEEIKYVVEGANEKIYQYRDKNIAKIKDITFANDFIYTGYNAVDGSTGSNWSSRMNEAFLQFELMETYKIEKVSLAHYLGAQRVQYFGLYTSLDGKKWTEVYKGESSGKTTNFQDVVFDAPIEAKYLKFVGYGNSDNEINNLSEIIIYVK